MDSLPPQTHIPMGSPHNSLASSTAASQVHIPRYVLHPFSYLSLWTHKLLPLMVLVLFTIAWTVVVVYALATKRALPAKFAIGASAAFGILALVWMVARWALSVRERWRKQSVSLGLEIGRGGAGVEARSSYTDPEQKWVPRFKKKLRAYLSEFVRSTMPPQAETSGAVHKDSSIHRAESAQLQQTERTDTRGDDVDSWGTRIPLNWPAVPTHEPGAAPAARSDKIPSSVEHGVPASTNQSTSRDLRGNPVIPWRTKNRDRLTVIHPSPQEYRDSLGLQTVRAGGKPMFHDTSPTRDNRGSQQMPARSPGDQNLGAMMNLPTTIGPMKPAHLRSGLELSRATVSPLPIHLPGQGNTAHDAAVQPRQAIVEHPPPHPVQQLPPRTAERISRHPAPDRTGRMGVRGGRMAGAGEQGARMGGDESGDVEEGGVRI